VRYPRPLHIGARRPFARPGTLRTPAHWCTNGAPFTHRRVSALPPARTHCTASSAHRPCTQLTRLGEPELASAASVASRPLPNGAPIAPPCTSSLTSYALLCPACERAAGGHGHGPRAASQPRVRQDLRQGWPPRLSSSARERSTARPLPLDSDQWQTTRPGFEPQRVETPRIASDPGRTCATSYRRQAAARRVASRAAARRAVYDRTRPVGVANAANAATAVAAVTALAVAVLAAAQRSALCSALVQCAGASVGAAVRSVGAAVSVWRTPGEWRGVVLWCGACARYRAPTRGRS
jgi:hypothetical protein